MHRRNAEAGGHPPFLKKKIISTYFCFRSSHALSISIDGVRRLPEDSVAPYAIHSYPRYPLSYLPTAKAYDRVDWHFLKSMLGALGFALMWINWIMTCVTTVKFAMRLNGQLLETFSPSCGLRQGDPLSPYLFLFVAEALSLLLQNACVSGTLKEFRLNKNAPGISHLLFTDDSLLFFKGSIDQALTIKNILNMYERGTG